MHFPRLLVALAAMTFTFTSCIDSSNDEVSFSIDLNGYILEEGSGDNTTFTPYFFFNSNNTLYKLATVEIEGVGDAKDSLIAVRPFSEYCFCTTGNTKVKSPDVLNGKYYINAKSTDGKSHSSLFEISFKSTDGLNPIQLDTLYYDGSYIRASIKEMSGIYSIGFILSGYNENGKPMREHYTYMSRAISPTFYNNKLDISYDVNTSSQLDCDYCEVKVYAATYNSIYRESRAKTLVKGEKTFKEDAQ